MKHFSIICSDILGVVLLSVIIDTAWGIYLPHNIINDAISEAKGSTLEHNLDLLTSTGNTPQVETAFKRLSPHQITPINGEATPLQGDMTFLRSRPRGDDTDCYVTNDTPVLLAGDLTTYLNATTLLGFKPDLQERPASSITTQNQCSTKTYWWRTSVPVCDNSNATCPWKYVIKDNGASFYPRYVQQAECLRPNCKMIASDLFKCTELLQSIAILNKTHCFNGHAVVVRTIMDLTVGCYCAQKA